MDRNKNRGLNEIRRMSQRILNMGGRKAPNKANENEVITINSELCIVIKKIGI